MKVTFAPKGIIQIDKAERITYKNFSGTASKYNREGDRNFALVINDQEIADALIEEGWNVKIKPPREEGDAPFIYLPVKVKFNEFGPNVYLVTGGRMNRLDEESVSVLDHVYLSEIDMDIRPYDWEVNGKTGRTAYLQSGRFTQDVTDRFYAEYESKETEEAF